MPTYLGEFRLLEPIGQGGMGQVFRARHSSGVLAAIKVLRPDADDDARGVLQRELTTMAQLDHPHVTWVYDVGTIPPNVAAAHGSLKEGTPWMALELAERGPLTDNYRDMSADAVQVLLHEILDALGHAHARGVVHRDLKPSNVLLAKDGSARLTDFGMVLLTEEHGTRVPVGGGTPSYMAPEQIDEGLGPQGPWSDLYALGILAWVLTTGKRPFTGESSEVMSHHLNTEPPEYLPRRGVPDGFGRWLASLLAKNPRHRVQRAADAKAALDMLGPIIPKVPQSFVPVDDQPTELNVTPVNAAPILRVEGPPTLPYIEASFPPAMRHPLRGTAVKSGLRLLGLREPMMVGRREERTTLWKKLLSSMFSGKSHTQLWRGAPGNGTTRLLRWAARSAHEQGLAEVIWASPMGWGITIRRTLCPNATSAAPLRQWGAERGCTEAEVSLLARLAGGEPVTPGDAHTGMLVMIRGLARSRPVVLVLDDIGLEPDLLAFAGRIAALTEDLPVSSLVATNDDVLAADPDLEKAWVAMAELPTSTEHVLGALSRAETLQLLHEVIDLAPRLEAQLAARCGGNPRFALEVIQAWADGGRLEATSRGYRLRGTAGALPRSITEATELRVERFLADHPDAETPLEIAGLMGPDVDIAIWKAATSVPTELLTTLLTARIATPDPNGAPWWSFPHSRIPEVLRGRALAGGRLRPHHRAIAAVLTARGAPPETIAPHLQGAGRPLEAGKAWLEVAITAMRDLRSADSVLAGARADEQLATAGLSPDHELRLMAETVNANSNLLRGRPEEQEDILTSVVARAPEGSMPHIEALLGLGVARGWQRDQEGCRGWLGMALRVAEDSKLPRAKERALERLARFESLAGNHDMACRLSAKVVREALDEGRAHRTAVIAFGRAGDLDKARHHAECSVLLLEARGRLGECAGTYNDLATMLTQGGDHQGAIEALDHSIRLARQSGSMHALTFGLGSLGLVQLRCGHYEDAVDTCAEAISMSGDHRLTALLSAALTWPLALLERWRDLDVALERASGLQATFGEDDIPDFLRRGADVARAAGEHQRAERADALLAGWLERIGG